MIPILHPSWTAVRVPRESHSFCMSFDLHWLAFQTSAQLEVHSPSSSLSISTSGRVEFGWLVDLANHPVLILCSGDSTQHHIPESPKLRIVDLGLLKITQLVFPRDEPSSVYGLFGSAEVARFAFRPTATSGGGGELQIQQYWDVGLQPHETGFGVALGFLFSLQDGKRILHRFLDPASKPATPVVLHEFDLEFDGMECVDGIQFALNRGASRFTWEDGELLLSADDGIPATAVPIKTSDRLFVSDSRVVFFSQSIGQALGESPTPEFAQQLCAANHWGNVEPDRLHFALQRGKVLPAMRALDSLLERGEFPPQALAWFRAHVRFIQSHGKLAARVQRLLQRATLAHQDEFQMEIAQCLAVVRPQPWPQLRRAATSTTAEVDQIELVRRSISAHLWNRWSPMESNEDVALEVLHLPQHMGSVCTFLQARGAIPPGQDALEFVLDCVKRRAYQYLLLSDFARARACLSKVGVDVDAFYRSVRGQTVNRSLRKRLGRHLALCLGDREESGKEEESFLQTLEALYPGRSHVVALRRSWADGALRNVQSSPKQFRNPAFLAALPKAVQDWKDLFSAPSPHLLEGDFAQPRHNVDAVLREAPRLDEREGEYEGDLGMKSVTYVRCPCLGENDDDDDASEVTPDLACDQFQGFFQLSSLIVLQSNLETRWRVLAQAGGVADLLAPSTKAWALQYFVDYNDSRGVDAWRQRFGTGEPWQAVMQSAASPFIRDLFPPDSPVAVPTAQLLREKGLVDCQDLLFPGTVYSSVFALALDQLGCGTAAEAKPKLGVKPYLALLALSPTEVDVPLEDLLEFSLLWQAAAYAPEPAEPLLLDDAVIIKLVDNLFGLRPGQPPREGKEGKPEAVELGPEFYLLHYRPHAAAKAATTQDLALVVRNLCLLHPHDWRLLQSGLEMLCKFQLAGGDGLEVDIRLLSALLMHAPSEMEREIVAMFAHGQDYAQVAFHRYSAFLPVANKEVTDLLARFCDLHGISPVGICQALRNTQERGAWESFANAFDPDHIAQAVLLPDCDLQAVWKAWLVAECSLAQSDTLYQTVSLCLENKDCANALQRSAKAFAGSFPQLAQFIQFRLALWEGKPVSSFPAVVEEGDFRHFALAELCKFWESTALVGTTRSVVLGAILDLVDMDAANFAEVLLARRSYSLALAVAQTVSLDLTVLRAAEKEAKRFGLENLPSSILASLFLNPANAVELALGLQCALKSHSKRACQNMFDEGRARMMEWPFPETLSVLVLCGDQLPVEMLRLAIVRCVAESRYGQLADWLNTQCDALPSKTKRRCWQLVCTLWSPSHERDVVAVGQALKLHPELAKWLETRLPT